MPINSPTTFDHSTQTPDWSNIPTPGDDGATHHLQGAQVPSIDLEATDGRLINLAHLHGLVVVYAYPRTGIPGIPNPEGWDLIPGARGCTPQSCSFRDHFSELKDIGVDHLFGLSTQDTTYQKQAATRLHLPFPLLSDERLELTRAMRLPAFEVSGVTLLKRFTLIINNGVISKVFYPVFPPDRNAINVVGWLKFKP